LSVEYRGETGDNNECCKDGGIQGIVSILLMVFQKHASIRSADGEGGCNLALPSIHQKRSEKR
jgi:hypothetical protein